MTAEGSINLQRLIENEYFIVCPFMPTDRFISFCRERSVNTSRGQLEQLEKLGIFRPIARIEHPKIKVKVEYIDDRRRVKDLGKLEDGEQWTGDIEEQYAHFLLEKEYAKSWFEEGFLWDPATRNFQEWKDFRDADKHEYITSYYSIFQAYTLYNIIRMTAMEVRAEWWCGYSQESISSLTEQISKWAHQVIESLREDGKRVRTASFAALICQVLSNRYYPKTQTDRRTITISGNRHDWNWRTYCLNWIALDVLRDLNVSLDDLKKLHELLSMDAKYIDPLQHWYSLISFVSLEEKKRLKGEAQLAQSIYSMEHMVRLFYKELTGEDLFSPAESPGWKEDKFYGEGIGEDELQFLEFLTNQFHLNPKPSLILVVEGNGEEQEFPRLSDELMGYSFPKLGIRVVNLNGIGGFTGKKKMDKYGALEKFIDFNHDRQTIVFVVLDKEGRTRTIREKLIKAPSKFYDGRYVTKEEYVHLWDKGSIEFDNFTFEEIAQAMSEVSKDKITFSADGVEQCYELQKKKEADHLSRLFKEKTGYDLPKRELLKALFSYILEDKRNGSDQDNALQRPIVSVLRQVIKLAALNYQPTCLEIKKKNQESGYLGDIKK